MYVLLCLVLFLVDTTRGGATVRPVAGAASGGHQGSADGPRRAAKPRDGLPAPAGIRVYPGGFAPVARSDGSPGRGTRRVHGYRHGPGGAVEPPASAVRLFQTTLCSGHEPAARRYPCRTGDV